MVSNPTITESQIWDILSSVCDPEIPVLSIVDMGIVRKVYLEDNNPVIIITPTYTGCPAMDMITLQIRMALLEHGFTNITIRSELAPAWTTDWMTEEGKRKLQEYGIAPPNPSTTALSEQIIQCPQCRSNNTQLISEFGSTACKALYQCQDCKEPFDYFKCH
jgi:ring-1,2-phenylacetyl-CoA epoxidase subunit PaaD